MYMNTAMNSMLAGTREAELAGRARTHATRHASHLDQAMAPEMTATSGAQPGGPALATARLPQPPASTVIVDMVPTAMITQEPRRPGRHTGRAAAATVSALAAALFLAALATVTATTNPPSNSGSQQQRCGSGECLAIKYP